MKWNLFIWHQIWLWFFWALLNSALKGNSPLCSTQVNWLRIKKLSEWAVYFHLVNFTCGIESPVTWVLSVGFSVCRANRLETMPPSHHIFILLLGSNARVVGSLCLPMAPRTSSTMCIPVSPSPIFSNVRMCTSKPVFTLELSNACGWVLTTPVTSCGRFAVQQISKESQLFYQRYLWFLLLPSKICFFTSVCIYTHQRGQCIWQDTTMVSITENITL